MTEQKLGFVPYMDTYIVVSLNAEATVDFYCDGLDDIARSEIRCITFKKYVGYCSDMKEQLPWPDREFHRIQFRPLQRGLSRSTRTAEVEPHMCVPVWPNIVHPYNRKPLRTTKPLPWSDCYHPTFPAFVLRVDTTVIDYSDATEADGSDAAELSITVAWDMIRITELAEAKAAGVDPPELVFPIYEEDEEEDEAPESSAPESSWSDFDSERSSIEEPHSDDDMDQPQDVQVEGASEDRTVETLPLTESLQHLAWAATEITDTHPEDDPYLIPIIRVSPILGELAEQELPDFHDIYAEYEALQGIIDRAKLRAKEASATDNLAVQRVEDASEANAEKVAQEKVQAQKTRKGGWDLRSFYREVKRVTVKLFGRTTGEA